MKLMLIVVLSMFLVGCSSTKRTVNYDNTYIRLERLERNVLERNKDIDEIKFAIERLEEKVDGQYMPGDSSSDVIIEDDYVSLDSVSTSSKSSSKDKIIRVPVSEKEVQIALKNAGYYDGKIDGKIGSKSIQAIKNFQKDFDLKMDGIIGRQTWKEMKQYLD